MPLAVRITVQTFKYIKKSLQEFVSWGARFQIKEPVIWEQKVD
jgi:hypothetical protein